jgi:regulator of sigma E protease
MPNDPLTIILLVLGFGFVIFFHELGHFLAAKWTGIKVEQFAVGFGQALLAWRKGIGLRIGTTNTEYRKRAEAYLDAHRPAGAPARDAEEGDSDAEIDKAGAALGLGETEYRLNWIPLGGYVKMLGQDDLNPNSQADDPRAYNRKSIPARMLVVSAGVIMNIILAAIGFMIVFKMGFHVPPARVGDLLPDSPAQRAGLRVGDYIETLDGKKQWDFTKLGFNTALLEPGVPVPMTVNRDGKLIHLTITPEHERGSAKGFVELGIAPYHDLAGLRDAVVKDDPKLDELVLPESLAVKPGEVITKINGRSVAPEDYEYFQSVVQNSFGKPIVLTVQTPDGNTRQETVYAHFIDPFSAGEFHLVGMVPRARIQEILPASPARGKLLPGDVIQAAYYANNDALTTPPTREELTDFLRDAGDKGQLVSMDVIRRINGIDTLVHVPDLQTGVKLEGGGRGLGIVLGLYDEDRPVVAQVLHDTPASRAGIPRGATITSINGEPISSWFDMHRALLQVTPDVPVPIEFTTASGQHEKKMLTVDPAQEAAVHAVRYETLLQLGDPKSAVRKADSIFQAAGWGITETRDLSLQFYLTLRRMFDGNVSPSNLMGPIGIFITGKTLAFRGYDWLIWFLSMISANLAVVNFLPIPIVDGGLFTFLILEKLQGKPLTPRTQAIAQYVGLAFLVGVFVFVTYHDIVRWL